MTKISSRLVLAALCVVAVPFSANAATQSVTANMAFDSPVSLTPVQDIDFGTVAAGTAETYVIDTAGTVTAGTASNILYGSTQAGEITVSGSTSQQVDISAGNYTANGGVTPSAATCKYGAGSEVACNTLTGATAPGASTTLLIGVSATSNTSPTAGGSAAPTFDITVAYQ